MSAESIPFRETHYFSSLICDYLDEDPRLNPFYNYFPTLENFKFQIEQKQKAFNPDTRLILENEILKQYKDISTSISTHEHIISLKKENTFTITTGHQLNLFTGPLYFLYKIISTINLCKELSQAYPKYNFVPMYWMATEDHDFDEINYFNFKGKKVTWSHESSGAVGELSTDGLKKVFTAFEKVLGSGVNEEKVKELFKNAYLNHNNLADATRFLANALFADYGLVILDANVKSLKQVFIPYLENELSSQLSFKSVSATNAQIEKLSYHVQVNPRDINLFYLKEGMRERITFKDTKYQVLNTNIIWTKDEILQEVRDNPECFSPNVIMRPLYQEVILPNLCYIGGGGELAYWFQLKSYFEEERIPFPILLLRNSVLIKTEKQSQKLKRLHLSNKDTFLNQDNLVNKKVIELSEIDIDFTEQKKHLEKQFADLYKLAEQTDKSFLGAVSAQERKQIKGLEHLEKRLLKAQKRKLSDQIKHALEIQNELFPNQSLQERQANFSEFYLEYGLELIPYLIENLEPLKSEFLMLTI